MEMNECIGKEVPFQDFCSPFVQFILNSDFVFYAFKLDYMDPGELLLLLFSADVRLSLIQGIFIFKLAFWVFHPYGMIF